MQIAPDNRIVEDLLFFPFDDTAYASCLQLMMQPQGKWLQRFDKTNTGVTVVASRVSRKLSVSKGRLWNPTVCWTTMWICKVRKLQTYLSSTFSTSWGLFQIMLPQPPLQSPLPPDSQQFCSGLAPRLCQWTTGLPWEQVCCSRQYRALEFYILECLVCACCYLKSPPGQQSPQCTACHVQKTGRHLWTLNLVLQIV